MKERRVSPVLFPYMELVFHDENIFFDSDKKDDVVLVKTNISNRQFGVVRLKAKCLMQQMTSSTPDIPVLSLWHLKNWKDRVAEDVTAFFLLDDEEKKFLEIYGD